MRTTITLDPDTEAFLRREMARTHVNFKRAVNDAIRRGLDAASDCRMQAIHPENVVCKRRSR